MLVDGANAGSRRDNKTSTPPFKWSDSRNFVEVMLHEFALQKLSVVCFGLMLKYD